MAVGPQLTATMGEEETKKKTNDLCSHILQFQDRVSVWHHDRSWSPVSEVTRLVAVVQSEPDHPLTGNQGCRGNRVLVKIIV